MERKIKFKDFLNLENWRTLETGSPIESILGFNPSILLLNDKVEIIKKNCKYKHHEWKKCHPFEFFFIFNKKVFIVNTHNLKFGEDARFVHSDELRYISTFKDKPEQYYGVFKTSIIIFLLKLKTRIQKRKLRKWQKSSLL